MLICLIFIGPTLVSTQTTAIVLMPFLLMVSWTIGMALTVVFVLVNRRATEESWRALRLVRGELPLPLAPLIGIAIALALDLTVSLASGRFFPVPQIWDFQSRGALGLSLALLLLVLLQPVAETLVFQAILLPRLRWTFGHWGGVIATSAVYTALHQVVFIEAYGFYSSIWHGIVFPMSMAITLLSAEGLYKVNQRGTCGADGRRSDLSAYGVGQNRPIFVRLDQASARTLSDSVADERSTL